jgi:formate dehydrogenase beta subunit
MLAAASLLLFLGLGASIVLAIASRVFYVWEDPKVLDVTDALPGANCGGCGFAGCASCAEAIAAGRTAVNTCVVGGFEVAQAVGAIMGQAVEAREPEFSSTTCIYGVGEADPIYTYNGTVDCHAAAMLYGGSKLCPIGCIGLGSCVKACQFDALHIGEDNLPVVNYDNCVGCGACVKACPKHIVSLTSATQRVVEEYVTDECTAPCQRACPTGIDIRGYIREISKGNYEESLRIIKEKCPLPLVCGYICPAPCELSCRRNLVDKGVAIDPLKRFVADYERSTGKHINPFKAPDNGLRIALVGGGTEGLTAAYYLARLGYQPTILEATPELGGILRHVIEPHRLPRDVLDHDIRGILDMGVEAKTGRVMGRDFTVDSLLKEGYDAVLLTTGGFDSRQLLHPDQKRYDASVGGVFTVLDFLTAMARGNEMDVGAHVVIAYAGAKALEIARHCKKLGSERVTIVTNQEMASLPEAFAESQALQAEGILVRPSTVIGSIGGVSGRLNRILLEDRDLDPETDGNREILDVDTLILSGGRLPEMVFVHAGGRPETPAKNVTWQTIETFRTYPAQGNKGILSPPEPGRVSDATAVVKAILSGRRLARAIHHYFTGGAIAPIKNLTVEAESVLDVTEVHDVSPSTRQHPPVPAGEQEGTSHPIPREPSPGLDEALAMREAERCLQCGLICYRKG